MKFFDVVIIGGGHNGLVAGELLARSGRKVAILEAGERFGGLAASYEFAPGLSAPICNFISKIPSFLHEKLQLEKHGFTNGKTGADTISLDAGSETLVLHGSYGAQLSGVTPEENEAFQTLRKRLMLQARLFADLERQVPVQPGSASFRQKAAIAYSMAKQRLSGTEEFRQLLRMALMCVADVTEEAAIGPRLCGLLGFDATLGYRLGPRSPTSLMGLYSRLAREIAGKGGGIVANSAAEGIAEVLARAASASGAVLMAASKVSSITMENGRATGIVLESGAEISARHVVSSISPIATFGQLVGYQNLETGFGREIALLRHKGSVSKLFLALDAWPDLKGGARYVHAPSTAHVETSFNAVKYRQMPSDPPFEFVICREQTGKAAAIVSVTIANTPYDLDAGWTGGRKKLASSILTRMNLLVPGLRKSVIASEVLAPPDIEARFNLPGGHWHHHDYQSDRMYALRPALGAGNYRTPVDGLWICGAGTHPGGGVTGLSGYLCASELMAERNGRWPA